MSISPPGWPGGSIKRSDVKSLFFLVFGFLCRLWNHIVVLQVGTKVTDEHTASIFRIYVRTEPVLFSEMFGSAYKTTPRCHNPEDHNITFSYFCIYSKTSLIRTNWERTLVQISESPNYGSATEHMFRELIKWTSRVLLGNTTLFWNIKLHNIK
jgi:hypothetical protein